MKRWNMLLIVFVGLLILTGCGSSDSEDIDEFELTLESNKNTFNLSEFSEDNQLGIKATLTYTGDADEIKLYHGSNIGSISLISTEGKESMEVSINSELKSTVIKQNESIVIYPSFPDAFYKNSKVKGDYRVVAQARFSETEDSENGLVITTTVMINLK